MTFAVGLAWLEAARFLRAQADDHSVDPRIQQAFLRRCVSTAYYAAFHMITGDCVLLCCTAPDSPFVDRLRRSIGHHDLKKVLASLVSADKAFKAKQGLDSSVFPVLLLRPFAETFITLQSAREHADYALDQPVDAVQADQAMAYLENLIQDWGSLGQDLKTQFAQQLLLRVMPNQR